MSGDPRGIVLRDLPGAPGTLDGMVAALHALGLRRCHLPGPQWVDADLDGAALDTARAALGAADVTVAVGLGAVNTTRPERAGDALRLGHGDLEAGLHRMVRAAARLGAESAHFTVGTEEDRFSTAPPWADQLAATAPLVRRLAERCADHGLPMVLKTHEEMTTFELARFREQVGHGGLLVGYSPVNVLCRLEDPVAAAARVADWTHTVFLDDADTAWTSRGLERRMRPLGEGRVDWPAVLAALASGRAPAPPRLVLDLHRAALDMPFTDPGWIDRHPDLTPAEFAAVAATATGAPPAPAADLAHRRTAGLARLAALPGLPQTQQPPRGAPAGR
ncbi:sugar phosphate isomerase/epimerase family protein [Actinacidiphila sp. bgisy145]|uniref:sugar phosphate isomerase/epimerase family protein n=1 Tax=Actinacidiphila sp. bgisy145 TaxID=3413792 RepID=UPI003EB8A3C8